MANFKRKHSRRHVKCCLCTPHRLGNHKEQKGIAEKRQMLRHTDEDDHALSR